MRKRESALLVCRALSSRDTVRPLQVRKRERVEEAEQESEEGEKTLAVEVDGGVSVGGYEVRPGVQLL